MTGTIDFTNCKKILGRAYNGANGKKIAVEYNRREYMLKFPPSGAMKPTELSYTNSCISEHIASSIFNMVGIKAQETLLGAYENRKKLDKLTYSLVGNSVAMPISKSKRYYVFLGVFL